MELAILLTVLAHVSMVGKGQVSFLFIYFYNNFLRKKEKKHQNMFVYISYFIFIYFFFFSDCSQRGCTDLTTYGPHCSLICSCDRNNTELYDTYSSFFLIYALTTYTWLDSIAGFFPQVCH